MYTVEFLENLDNVASFFEKAVQKAIENTALAQGGSSTANHFITEIARCGEF